MVKNNHCDANRRKLDKLLRHEEVESMHDSLSGVLEALRFMAEVGNDLIVVSDMAAGKSHIIAGAFARNLALGDYSQENSIWENRILSLMSMQEREEKYISELRFFHFLRHLPRSRRADYYLLSKLRLRFADGNVHDVLHRMYYIFDEKNENVRYAICLYGPMPFAFNGKSFAVNSITGVAEELAVTNGSSILSPRECQVLSLVDKGMKSAEIADRLCISIHTVNRHRQEIIGRLQVKNSHEACRVAKALKIIG